MEGQRYFVVAEDTSISMRYAKNLAEGNGLVYNPGGPRVEGFTNPLYVLYMSLFHFLPLHPSKIGLCIIVTCVIFLLLNMFVIWQIAYRISGTQSVAVGLSL